MGKYDGKVVINTALDNKGLEKGLGSIPGSLGGLTKTVTRIVTVISAAFATAAVAITKQSVAAYAEHEQLTGGIETLFKNSAEKVKGYAEDAFYTAGVSANKYMETVTSFSAGLISSLGGDTEKAADIANMAMIDMSDNANKMGSTLESIQNAYQGFAKQNYTLLDNLKLGYGGTKTEMERLLADAQKLTGIKYDISNLSDVYSAIHIIQENLDIAGTTAKEAEKTITGAGNMTKAAWKNVLAAISGGGDLDKAINNLVYSISKYFENIVPVVERSLAGIGQLIEKIAPQLVQSVATALIKAIPSLLNAVYQMILGLAKGIYQGIVALFTGGSATGPVSAQLNDVAESAGAAADAEKELADGITEAGKAAKKSLASFDELNILQSPDSGNGSSDTSGMNYDFVEDSLQGSEEIKRIMNDLKKDILEGNWFGAGETLGQAIMDGIMSVDWNSVGTKIGDILGGILSFALGLALSIDPFQLVGAINGFVGGLFQGLAEKIQMLDWGDIGAKLVKALLFGVLMADPSTAILTILFSPNSDKLMSGAAELIGSIIGALIKAVIGMAKEIGRIGQEIWNTLKGYFDEYVDWEGTPGEIIAGLFNGIVDALKNVGTWIKENIFDPFIEGFCEAFDINSPAGEMKEPGKNIIFGMLEGILEALKSIGTWIEENVFDPFMEAFKSAFGINGTSSKEMEGQGGNLITSLLSGIRTAWTSIPGFFTEAFETVKRKLKEIWENGIVPAIKKPVNSIIGFINGMMSGVVTGINTVIRALNRINFSIPDWDIFGSLAGKKFGFSFSTITAPQIPLLAKGAVLPPNKPFLAMVGDQRHGTNVEAPLATIQEAVALVMQDQTNAILAGFEASVGVQKEILEAVLGIQIGDDVIGSAVARYNRKQAIIYGGTL